MSDEQPDLAVIGGGQLARMMQQAAIGLGVRIRLLAEAEGVSAAQVIVDQQVGDHTVLADLLDVCRGVDVVTFDHEHVPPEHLKALDEAGHSPRPGPHALIFAQDKLDMRERLVELAIPAPAHAEISTPADLQAFADRVGGFPVILKTTRGGYDGKGVWKIDTSDDAEAAFASGVRLMAEEFVPFTRELSAQVARRPSGQIVTYPVVASRQENGICREVIAPAPDLSPELAAAATDIAVRVATELDVVGMLAVELFETADGRVLVNEFAMRPHNTGHWSIDGAVTSQFENHLRAVLDLPLGPSDPVAPVSVMVNILGGAVTDLAAQRATVWDEVPEAKIHLYGKDVKPGRKVGHLTVTGQDVDQVLARARRAADLLENG